MSADPQSSSQSDSTPERLPFEPRQKRKKKPNQKPPAAVNAQALEQKERGNQAQEPGIPDVVSKRMLRRMIIFCSIPTVLSLSTFVISYVLISQTDIELPTPAVLLVSTGLFGLGVLGLSYGVLSASWDEDRVGNWFGWQEFTTNFGRMTSAWRAARSEAKGK